jgi:hypothetical protein
MTPPEALQRARAAGATRQVFYWDHALDRMCERNVKNADVLHALANATAATDQDQAPGRWRVTGPDLDGEPLVVVAQFDGRFEVVTLL